MVHQVEPYSSCIGTFTGECKAYIENPDYKITYLIEPFKKLVKRIDGENLRNDEEFNTHTRIVFSWLKGFEEDRSGSKSNSTKAASETNEAKNLSKFAHEIDNILISLWEKIKTYKERKHKEPYISSLQEFINKCKDYVVDPDNKLTIDSLGLEGRFEEMKYDFLEEIFDLRNGDEFTRRAKKFSERVQIIIEGKDSDIRGTREEDEPSKEDEYEVTGTKGQAMEVDMEGKEEKNNKSKLFAQEVDVLLKEAQTKIRTKQKENLKLSGCLLRYLGHDLQRYPGVCGYSLSGVYMKCEVKMLQVGNGDNNIKRVAGFIEEKIKGHPHDFQNKKLSDLVQFVIIRKLPKLVPDLPDMIGPRLDLKLEEHKKILTPGVFFNTPEMEDKVLLSTCTHGDDNMQRFTYEVRMRQNEPCFEGEYWKHIYKEPTNCSDDPEYQPEQEHGQNAQPEVEQQGLSDVNTDQSQAMNSGYSENAKGTSTSGFDKQLETPDENYHTNQVSTRDHMSEFFHQRIPKQLQRTAARNAYEKQDNIDVSQSYSFNDNLTVDDQTETGATGTTSSFSFLCPNPDGRTAAQSPGIEPEVCPSKTSQCHTAVPKQSFGKLRNVSSEKVAHNSSLQAGGCNPGNPSTETVRNKNSLQARGYSPRNTRSQDKFAKNSALKQTEGQEEVVYFRDACSSLDGNVLDLNNLSHWTTQETRAGASETVSYQGTFQMDQSDQIEEQSTASSTESMGANGFSSLGKLQQHTPSIPCGSSEEATESNNTYNMDNVILEYGDDSSEVNRSSESLPGGASEINTETDKPIHYDLCLIAVPVDKVELYTGNGSVRSDNYFKIEDMRLVTVVDLSENVQKIGYKTGKTTGTLVNCGGRLKCRLGNKDIWLYDVLVVEQDHKFPINEVTENSDLPIVLRDAEAENSTHASEEWYPENTFVKQGDSGAIITLNNEAIGNHLYHFNTNDNAYSKTLNYSVSCHLKKAVDDYCKEHGEITFMPTTIFM